LARRVPWRTVLPHARVRARTPRGVFGRSAKTTPPAHESRGECWYVRVSSTGIAARLDGLRVPSIGSGEAASRPGPDADTPTSAGTSERTSAAALAEPFTPFAWAIGSERPHLGLSEVGRLGRCRRLAPSLRALRAVPSRAHARVGRASTRWSVTTLLL